MSEQSPNQSALIRQIQALQAAAGLPVMGDNPSAAPGPAVIDAAADEVAAPEVPALPTAGGDITAEAAPTPVPVTPPDRPPATAVPIAAQTAAAASGTSDQVTISRADLNDMIRNVVQSALQSNRSPDAGAVASAPGSPAEATMAEALSDKDAEGNPKSAALAYFPVWTAGGNHVQAFLYEDGTVQLK